MYGGEGTDAAGGDGHVAKLVLGGGEEVAAAHYFLLGLEKRAGSASCFAGEWEVEASRHILRGLEM